MGRRQVKITLRIWRQQQREDSGRMVTYHLDDISPDMSFLEMLDVLNQQLTLSGVDPVAFDSDCREGICGICGLVINGIAHGPEAAIATCQLQMHSFRDGDVIDIEPWRARPFSGPEGPRG
jgi:succinate dehydrogenase iron-sulfur subunit